MVAKRQCSFCAQEIEPGTGTIYVKRDGTVYQFCSSSCRKQQLHLGRIGHRFKWTRAYALKRAAERSTVERAPGTPTPSGPGVRAGRHAAERGRPAATPAVAPAPEAPNEPAPAAAAPPPKKPRAKPAAKATPKSPTKAAAKSDPKPSSNDA